MNHNIEHRAFWPDHVEIQSLNLLVEKLESFAKIAKSIGVVEVELNKKFERNKPTLNRTCSDTPGKEIKIGNYISI